MAQTTIAQPSHTVPEETKARVLRGLKLYREHGDEIERASRPATFYVPSCSGEERYEVSLGFGEDSPSCTCPDFEQHGLSCKHCYALQVWISRRNVRKPATPRNRRPVAEFAAVA